MRAFCRLLAATLLLLSAGRPAASAEDNWRFAVTADDAHNAYASTSQIGFYPSSLDGYDDGYAPQDAFPDYLPLPDGTQYAAWATGVIPGRTEQMKKDIKAPFATNDTLPSKSWNLRVYALKDAGYTNIRLRFFSVNTSTAFMTPGSINGVQIEYYLKLTDNRGVIGAPANGTEWIVPTMTVISTINPFFTLVLPTGYGSGGPDIIINPSTYENAEAEGYMMEFGLRPVPEPCSLLALGSIVGGLGALILRRRKQ